MSNKHRDSGDNQTSSMPESLLTEPNPEVVAKPESEVVPNAEVPVNATVSAPSQMTYVPTQSS